VVSSGGTLTVMRVPRVVAVATSSLIIAAAAVGACSSNGSSPSPAADAATGSPDAIAADASAGVEAAGDARPDASVTPACLDAGGALSCAPNDTWFALSNGPGRAVGDPEPATPDQVGDGMWHLFVGVDLTTDGGTTYVLIYDSTSPTPDGTFTLATAPLEATNDVYDLHGKETPSYLRTDAHTEYVYYTADTSYVPFAASVAALRRVDGGAWTKVGIVAPFAADEIVQVDPTVAFDPASGQYVLLYESLVTPDAGAATLGIVSRTSSDPTHFDPSTRQWVTSGAATTGSIAPARLALSHDDVGGVWRVAFDLADYPSGGYAYETRQTWTTTPVPPASALTDAAPFLHDGDHALHPALHLDGTTCTMSTCPQGAVLQPSKAVYPDGGDVIFYYAGWSTLPGLQVNGQRCTRSAP
jgi:hypothetical protein